MPLDIRDPGAADELQRGVLLEERHHMPPGIEQRDPRPPA
jgi:hypothetical protein